MIVDTDVIVWFLRGNENAKQILTNSEPLQISLVTKFELFQGCRTKREMGLVLKQLSVWKTVVLPINDEISNTAFILTKEFFLSHHLLMQDALIAASALYFKDEILTGNTKHYSFIPGISCHKFEHFP